MYALATLPLSERLPNDVTQVWYADDACACGSIVQLRHWWERRCRIGPGYGYFVNAEKTWLLTKSAFQSAAVAQFIGSGVNVTCKGRPYLGAAIGTQEYIRKFMGDKVTEWSAEVQLLAKLGESQPHAAYTTLTHSLSSQWYYVFRTVPNVAEFLQPLEDVICCTLLPALLGISPPNDAVRNLIALPPRWGVWKCLIQLCNVSWNTLLSVDITGLLSNFIVSGNSIEYFMVQSTQISRKSSIRSSRQSLYSDSFSSLRSQLDQSLKTALDLATIRGASAWLSALPLSEYGFSLHKAAFHDAVALHYGWPLQQTPSYCACGAAFSVDHALSCPKGGLSSLRHNEIRNLTVRLLTKVCHQVQMEPELQPVSDPDTFSHATANSQDGARLDIVMNGFWGGRSERCFRMFEFSIPMLNLMFIPSLQLTDAMKTLKGEHTARGSGKFNMIHLHQL